MKLYSRNQLIVAVTTGVILATSVTSLVFIKPRKNEQTAQNASTTSLSQNVPGNNSVSSETQTSFLQENTTSPASNVATDNTQYTQEELQNISVYERCSQSVVNINTKITGVNWFLEPIVQDGGSGSGSIIDRRGYILTNVHVIANASQIYVSLSDGTQYEAKIIGQDEESDLAVIKFNPPVGTVLQTIPFGDSEKLKVGQKVIAIGNPFGLERTMTTGIVSGLGRPIKNSNDRIIRNMIQTDTAINPGNSGGPLLDTSGRMIGINTMILSSSGNSAGVGFAVPAETAVRVIADLLKYGKVNRGVIQASTIQLNSAIIQYADLDIGSGVLISQVTRGGNADAAGLRGGTQAARYGYDTVYLGGDIITQIDAIKVSSLADYFSALESKRPGDTVTVTIHRNRKNMTMNVVLAVPTK
jgi:S1-C subfamily serine protease